MDAKLSLGYLSSFCRNVPPSCAGHQDPQGPLELQCLGRPHPAGICQGSLLQTSGISNPWKRLCGLSSPTHGSSQLALRGTP